MSSAHVLWISLVSILVVVAMSFALRVSANRHLVRAHSPVLAAAAQLNAEFAGRMVRLPAVRYTFSMEARSKATFDRTDLMAFYYECLLEREPEILATLSQHRQIAAAHGEYMRLFTSLTERNEKSASTRLSAERFAAIERRLLRRSLLRKPKSHARVECCVSYQSPKGRNSYSKSMHNDFEQFATHFEHALSVAARQATAQRQRARERSLMTASLRYEILKRDGHRCKSCGASSASGAVLHIDHIFPVSKGGRTTRGNLQTLCEACNLGKRDR